MPKPGDLVEVRRPSRYSPSGEEWVAAIIESLDPAYHHTPESNIRVRTICGDAKADARIYQSFQVRKPNILIALAIAAADPGEIHSPYTEPAEYANTKAPCLPSRGLADGPQTTERTDPAEILLTIIQLDQIRTQGLEKVPSHQPVSRGRRLVRGLRWFVAWAVSGLRSLIRW